MISWQTYWILLILGSLQGIILGIILLVNQKGHRPTRTFLALLLFLSAYRLLAEFLRSSEVTMDHWAYHVLLEFHWAFGPLLYCYVKSFLDPTFRLKGKYWLFFIPLGIQIGFSFWVKAQNFFWQGSPSDLPYLGSESYQLWMHTPFQYLVLCALILYFSFRASKLVKATGERALNPVQKNGLSWIKMILIAYQIYAGLTILLTLVDFLFFDYAFEPFYPFPVFIGMAGLTYWLALSGYANREATLPPPPSDNAIKPKPEWVGIMERLEQFMERERAYLDPELSLAKLAGSLDLKNYQVTQALNRVRQQTFSQYINTYRVAAAKEFLHSPSHANFTLLAIGFDAGFNSKASFNRVFKATTGMSPSEYQKQASSSQ